VLLLQQSSSSPHPGQSRVPSHTYLKLKHFSENLHLNPVQVVVVGCWVVVRKVVAVVVVVVEAGAVVVGQFCSSSPFGQSNLPLHLSLESIEK